MIRVRSSKFVALPLVAIGIAACDSTPPPVGMARGEELFETCAPCHGETGAGNADIETPAIAGLPQWYLQSQLQSFQEGWRGQHADDIPGLRMRPMAVTLNRDGDIESVSKYLAMGGDANARDDKQMTLLNLAALTGQTEIAKVLIEGGADVNATNGDQTTPLHSAAFTGRVELAKLLLT